MNSIYLLLGGNLGDRELTMSNAKQFIQEQIGEIVNSSNIYETAAWGVKDQPAFLNQVLEVQSSLSAESILEKIHIIEAALGRQRFEKWHARTIDIDILYFNDQVINTSDLKVPHPEIQNRMFTLKPLNEIADNYVHPIFKVSNKALLDKCTDNLEVSVFTSLEVATS